MKKTRFIPFGYTVKNGKTVIEKDEAAVVRRIFEAYLQGDSLKDIADVLTAMKIPYTEKTAVWDKARIARIIDNARYTGDDEYELIIDTETYEQASQLKSSRQIQQLQKESKDVLEIKKYIRCGQCGSLMLRRTKNALKIRESWHCTNPECGFSIRIPDKQLLENINILVNRIITNEHLLTPTATQAPIQSQVLNELNNDISRELERDAPCEEYIIEKTIEIAQELYRCSNNRNTIIAAIAKKRVRMMKHQDELNLGYLMELMEYITLDSYGKVTLHTKTGTEVESQDNGSRQDP